MAGKIGTVDVFDLRGAMPVPQKSVGAVYHADGVELDATDVRGAPFTLQAVILDTVDGYAATLEALAALCGADPVTIVFGNGLAYPDCFIGAEAPGGGVVPGEPADVIHEGAQKVLVTVAVSGHRDA